MRLRVTRLAQWDVTRFTIKLPPINPPQPSVGSNVRENNSIFSQRIQALAKPRDEIRPAIRSFSHGNYVIFFRVSTDSWKSFASSTADGMSIRCFDSPGHFAANVRDFSR